MVSHPLQKMLSAQARPRGTSAQAFYVSPIVGKGKEKPAPADLAGQTPGQQEKLQEALGGKGGESSPHDNETFDRFISHFPGNCKLFLKGRF